MEESTHREDFEKIQEEQKKLFQQIQEALSTWTYKELFGRFIHDIKSVDEKVDFMKKSHRLWIQSTKEHWVGAYGISDLIKLWS